MTSDCMRKLIGELYSTNNIGQRVKLIGRAPGRYSCYKLEGKIGTVRATYGENNIAVKVDGMFNKTSNSGCFYFRPHDLESLGENAYVTNDDIKEENNMSNSNITNYFNAIKVKFIDDGNVSRHVYANFDTDVNVGDLVVVKPAHHDVALARVEEILPDNTYETTREVIAKVDTTYYKERVEAREKIAKVKAQMQERAKKLQDIALYQMLAKDDPEMAQLLADYHSLPQY